MSAPPPYSEDLDQHPLATVWRAGQVIMIADAAPDYRTSWLILPALAALKTPERWMTWISPPFKPAPEALRTHRINPRHLRILKRRTRRESLSAAEQALASHTNDIVLVWIQRCTANDLERLHRFARETGTRGLVVTSSPVVERSPVRSDTGADTGAEARSADAPQLGLQLD